MLMVMTISLSIEGPGEFNSEFRKQIILRPTLDGVRRLVQEGIDQVGEVFAVLGCVTVEESCPIDAVVAADEQGAGAGQTTTMESGELSWKTPGWSNVP